MAVYTPRRAASGGASPAGALTWDAHPQDGGVNLVKLPGRWSLVRVALGD